MVDVIGISLGGAEGLTTTAEADYRLSQMVPIGSGVTTTQPFSTLNTVVSLRANVACWFSVGGTAGVHVAGSDFLPANVTWQIKIPQGVALSFIQNTGPGWVSVTPLGNPVYGVLPASAFDWDFTTGALPAGMTWTRTAGATATYFNSSGVLVTGVAINTPRFDYDPISLLPRGVLVESQITNSCLWSRDLTNAVWVKTNATAALTQTGLTGVANSASLLTASAANGTALQSITIASAAYCLSAYVKRVTGSGVVQMTMDGGATWTNVTVTAAWTRVAIPTQTLANPQVGFRLATSGDAIAVDCVDNANLTFPTSTIPTTSATVTRGPDTGTLTPIAWYNASQGTFLAQFDCGLGLPSVNQATIQLDDGTNNNRIVLRAASTWDAFIAVAGPVVYVTNGPVAKVPGSGPVKDAIAYGGGVAAQGAAAGLLSTTASVPSTSLPSGINRLSSTTVNAWVRRLTYWNVALSNQQLVTATT